MSREIFSVPAFIAWAETQDPKTTYDWLDYDDCLGMKYLKARGVQDCGTAYNAMSKVIAAGGIFVLRPWTIGAALDRARAVVEG